MPILWRYLLGQYLRVFLLSTFAFLAILLTTRLDDIAHFATLGSQGRFVLLYTLYQIPYILPIAIPISALISTVILMQRLSASHELTAFRAAGFNLRNILSPLLSGALFLAVCNFYIVSELATQSHLQAGLLKTELRSINPLLLLHNKHLLKLKGMYFDALGATKMGEFAEDAIIAMPSKDQKRMSLVVAKQLNAKNQQFSTEHLTVLSSNGKEENDSEALVVENIEASEASMKDFSHLLQQKVWSLNEDHLRFGLLRARLQTEKAKLKEATSSNKPSEDIKVLKRHINRGYTEVGRRVSVSVAVLTFTLMGAAFAIQIGRHRSHKGVFWIVALAALFLVGFFLAKGIEHSLWIALSLYSVPHLIIVGFSFRALNRVSKGVE